MASRYRYLVTFERDGEIIAQEVIKADNEETARRKAAKRYPEIRGDDQSTKVRVSEVSNADRT